ncbi:MAG: NBR1-Ig-like domain-containing protein [Bacteroidetes bacterium]|nr:NBR1-Ig-like domain-containing protein [Bacteroidota bacterium]MCL5026691.1 NBR1-Ig-like domain-containing protein [Chloroflexota bacterium]
MSQRARYRFVSYLLLLVLAAGVALPPAGQPVYAASPSDEILARAKTWVDANVPYSMTAKYQGYRTDCSGFVSYAWSLPPPGLTTDTLGYVAVEIPKDRLQPGDILNNRARGVAGHTLIFAGWADAGKTKYNAYEMSAAAKYGSKAHYATNIPYPFWDNEGGVYVPMRLKRLAAGLNDRAEQDGQSPPVSVGRGERFTVWFQLKNTGDTVWSPAGDYHLANINGQTFGLSPRQNVGGPVSSGGQYKWTLANMVAPNQPGEYWTWWTLRRASTDFGPSLGLKVVVRPAVPGQPGGNWIAPDPGDVDLGGTIGVAFHAYDRDGAAANISKVDFTVRTGGVWRVERTLHTSDNKPDNPTRFSFNWDTSKLPDGAVTIAFDVYDKSGKVARAPDGTLRLRGPSDGEMAANSALVNDGRYFAETGFSISDDRFWDYFQKRGGLRTFGYPVSRKFALLGTDVQIFQRRVMQARGGTVGLLNLLDADFMPYSTFKGATIPNKDDKLVAKAPPPGSPNYANGIIDYVRQASPDTWNNMPVSYFQTFASTVTVDDAYPDGSCDDSCLPGLDLEMWGVPLSPPAVDPRNYNFVYQRYQRGIMHFDKGTGTTQGMLLGDMFKAIITGQGLPPDLEAAAAKSRFYRQYNYAASNGLVRPAELPATDMSNAFEPD